jgi:chemotaxis response regulator CheB
MTAVLVCDDAADMRALLRDALEDDPGLHVVGEADDGVATLALAAELQPDVVLLDIGMPGPATGDIVAGVRRAAPGAAIVVLSGYGPERLDPRAAGEVHAHLPKTTDLAAIRRTLRAAGGAG